MLPPPRLFNEEASVVPPILAEPSVVEDADELIGRLLLLPLVEEQALRMRSLSGWIPSGLVVGHLLQGLVFRHHDLNMLIQVLLLMLI